MAKERKELTFNGRRFIPARQADVPAGVAGRYRTRKSGVLLMDLDGKPFGFVCSNDDYGRAGRGPGFLVSAYSTTEGTRYMAGAASVTLEKLGLPKDAGHSLKQQMCASMLAQAAA
jgi:hypothetical protein